MFELLDILLKYAKIILGASFIVALAAAGISLFMPNYYKSVCSFKPANPLMLDRNSVFPKEGIKSDFYMFGGKEDIDRVISLGTSGMMYGYLIDKFDLYKHYDIDTTSALKQFKVVKKLQSNYEISKNALGAVDVAVLDKDPQIAAAMSNAIAYKIDSLNIALIFDKKRELLPILQTEYNKIETTINTLRDSVQNIVRNNPKDTLSTNLLSSLIGSNMETLNSLQQNLTETQALLSKPLSSLYFIEMASPAVRKDKPVRSLIVIGAALFTFIVMCVAAVFVEKFAAYRKSQGK
ncbi:MAG: hypothetical protein R2798_14620 [Chitinophagales bacterium]